MNQTKSLVLVAGAALGLGCAGAALASQADRDEVRAIVAEMLADAETRASLLSSNAAAGHDGAGFYLGDDNNRLNFGGQLQMRYVLNFRDNSADDDFDPGFEMRRTKIWFDGHINRDWFYRVSGNFNSQNNAPFIFELLDTETPDHNGTFRLEDAYAGYDFGNGFKVRWGQFKLPVLREELVDSKYQLAAERSIMNSVFGQRWSQGVELSYEDEDFNVKFAFSDGARSANSGFSHMASGDYGLSARGEVKLAGAWDQFRDFTAQAGDDFALLIGAAVHHDVLTVGANPTGSQTDHPGDLDFSNFVYTADISAKGGAWNGWNAYAAFVGQYQNVNFLGGDADFNDFGVVVQGGVRVVDNTELFARWDAVWFDKDRTGINVNNHFITFGLNQYYAGHAAKATTDIVIGLNDGAIYDPGAGMLFDPKAGQVAWRIQIQLLF